MVWRWSLIIYQPDFHRDAEFGRHTLPIPCASEPQVSQQSQFLASWGMSAQTLSPDAFLEPQNTKANKSCNDSGPACPGPTAAHGKMQSFYPRPRLICQGIFLLVRGKKTKQDMLELPLRWWVLLLPCHSAEQGGWGRSPGSKPRSACCTFLQKASHLAQSPRNRVSRQQTNKSGLIEKENTPPE